MKCIVSVGSLFLAACATAPVAAPRADADALVGTWAVSLYFDPDSPPSSTELVVSAVGESGFEGTFYGAPIQEGRLGERNGAVVFGGVTADQSGFYFHSGRLTADGVMEGQTLSEGRDFLMPWSAVKE